MSIELTQLDTDEILRYMGCPPDQAGADLRNQAQLCGCLLYTSDAADD